MNTTLDVNSLPFSQTYTIERTGETFQLANFIQRFRSTVTMLGSSGIIPPVDGLGIAIATPQWEGEPGPEQHWDDPQKFVWVVNGWGDSDLRLQLIANAVRKLRPVLRLGYASSLDLRYFSPDLFADIVDSIEEDGSFAWGDFPWGGAVMIQIGDLTLCVAVSGATETQDHVLSMLFGYMLGEKILVGEGLVPKSLLVKS